MNLSVKDEHISDVLLWILTPGRPGVGRSAKTHTYQLCADTGFSLEDLPRTMDDRDGWRKRVKELHPISMRRCPRCNGYRRWKWTRRLEFKSWTRMIAFHITLIPLGKVWIQLFSLQLWVNSRTDWVLQPWWGNKSRRRKTLNSNLLDSA